jgi:hypothetical protein
MTKDIVLPVHLGHSEEKGVAQGAEAIARTLGVHRQTILRWKRKGAPIFLVGRKYQCRYDDLWEWVKGHEDDLYESEEKE